MQSVIPIFIIHKNIRTIIKNIRIIDNLFRINQEYDQLLINFSSCSIQESFEVLLSLIKLFFRSMATIAIPFKIVQVFSKMRTALHKVDDSSAPTASHFFAIYWLVPFFLSILKNIGVQREETEKCPFIHSVAFAELQAVFLQPHHCVIIQAV